METLIRKTWPKIKIIYVDGLKLYQVDLRRKGTNPPVKRPSFQSRRDAEKLAQETEEAYRLEGAEGMALSAELRVAAVKGEILLAKFGKSLADAVAFYVHHLETEEKRKNSLTVSFLADAWLESKSKNKNKVLRQDTIDDITETSKKLKAQWGQLRISETSEKLFQDYLDSLAVSQQRKFNVRSLFSQFFNWCIKNKHTTENPLKDIEIQVLEKDIQILSVKECSEIMQKIETEYSALLPYHAICLFAGLRPTEAKLLQWEDIRMGEKEIDVYADTSKRKVSRTVRIETTLLHWLNEWKGSKWGGPRFQTSRGLK